MVQQEEYVYSREEQYRPGVLDSTADVSAAVQEHKGPPCLAEGLAAQQVPA